MQVCGRSPAMPAPANSCAAPSKPMLPSLPGTVSAYWGMALQGRVSGACGLVFFAGAEIIAENIRNEGDINPMVPGKKTVGIFGFCDIRRFTDATEVLQVGVL